MLVSDISTAVSACIRYKHCGHVRYVLVQYVASYKASLSSPSSQARHFCDVVAVGSTAEQATTSTRKKKLRRYVHERAAVQHRQRRDDTLLPGFNGGATFVLPLHRFERAYLALLPMFYGTISFQATRLLRKTPALLLRVPTVRLRLNLNP